MMRRVLCAGAAALAAVLAGGPAVANDQGVTDNTILIGVEGDAKSFSSDEENIGMKLAVLWINDRGGIHGRKIATRGYPRTKTGAAATEEIVANAKKLVEVDKVFLLYNHAGPSAVAIGKYAMAAKVPYVFPHTALLTVDGARYVFTSFPRYAGETVIMFRYLAQSRGLKRIGIVHDENVYGTYFRDRLNQFAGQFGYIVVGAKELKSRDPGDLTADLRALKDAKADAIYLAVYPLQAKRVMEAKAKLGWKEARVVTTGPLSDEQYLNMPGGYAEGALGFCYYPDPNVSTEPGVVAYREAMQKYYPGKELNRYSLYGLTFGRLVIEGMTRAGRNLTRETFIDAMETIQGWSSGGVMPPVSFSKTDHHAQKAGFICELKDGKFQPQSDWIAP